MKVSIFAVFLLAFVAKEVASQGCHLREIDLCMAVGMLHYQSYGIPEDEVKVDDFCGNYNEVKGCMSNFTNTCLSPLQKELMGLFAGADEPAIRLCTKGSEVRTKYLKHSACLAEAADNDNFKAAMRDLRVGLERVFDIPFHERLAGLCCGLKRFQADIDKNTETTCGKESVEMTRYILNMLLTDLPNLVCQRYNPASEDCKAILPPPGSPGKDHESKSRLGKLLDTMFGM